MEVSQNEWVGRRCGISPAMSDGIGSEIFFGPFGRSHIHDRVYLFKRWAKR
jgi:hypothetical protein